MNQIELWKLSPEQFNQLRAENDLLRLYEFFSLRLPLFLEWADAFDVSVDEFVLAPRTGQWFVGEQERSLFEYEENGISKCLICEDFEDMGKGLGVRRAEWVTREKRFVPYLKWARKKARKDRFIPAAGSPGAYTDTIEYNQWDAQGAHLFGEHPVLNLSRSIVPWPHKLGERNLDFTCLDGIVITGKLGGSGAAEFNFSSCNNLRIVSTSVAFLSAHSSYFDDLEITDSYLQDFAFEKCRMRDMRVTRSEIRNFEANQCMLAGPAFRETYMSGIVYEPLRGVHTHSSTVSTSRRIRAALHSCGQNHEAQKFYYMQRSAERKNLWNPYREHQKRFPRRSYSGTHSDILKRLKGKEIGFHQALGFFLSKLAFHTKCWLVPRYAAVTVKYKIRYVLSLFSCLLWGYGVRPVRIAVFAFACIFLFSIVYYIHGPTAGDDISSLYFSTVTFTTLGYGEINPGSSSGLKIVCAIEALLGVLTLGLAVGAISRKESY